MPEDLRHLIARALSDHDQAGRGLDQDHYRAEEWLCCADAVLAALDQATPPRYSLGYGHDELTLWCDPCADVDGRPLKTWYGAPTALAEVAEAAREHEAGHAQDSERGASGG